MIRDDRKVVRSCLLIRPNQPLTFICTIQLERKRSGLLARATLYVNHTLSSLNQYEWQREIVFNTSNEFPRQGRNSVQTYSPAKMCTFLHDVPPYLVRPQKLS